MPQVVPMENREGRKLIERSGDFCERKNGNGVDPNRNWAVDWGVREADFSAYEESAGERAFSEPEAYIMREVVHDFKPHAWVNIHSGTSFQPKIVCLSPCHVYCCVMQLQRAHITVGLPVIFRDL